MFRQELASMIDVTMVQNHHTREEILQLTDMARQYRCAAVFVLPCYTELISRQLSGSGVRVGGVTGFPDGGITTAAKLFEAEDALANGAEEVDMVINLGWLKSGMDKAVEDEVASIKKLVGSRPLKCIIEVNDLTEDEIKRASLLVVSGGADYVKTSTGWRGGTKLEHVNLIRDAIGDTAKIKVAGGIRDLDTALAFIDAGASRLGIGFEGACRILQEAEEQDRV